MSKAKDTRPTLLGLKDLFEGDVVTFRSEPHEYSQKFVVTGLETNNEGKETGRVVICGLFLSLATPVMSFAVNPSILVKA